VRAVDQIRYVDLEGDVLTLDPATYVVSGLGDVARIHLAPHRSWPGISCQPEAITIDVTAGYGDSWNDVPEPIRSAIGETVRGLFDGCSPGAVQELLQFYRVRAV
jgi:uncharacterized phiE125 gp8 family phage protein